jgi:site-specific recombinase XerD
VIWTHSRLAQRGYFDQYEADFFARHGKPPAANTRSKVDQAIRNFFKWAERYDYVTKTPMRQIDSPRLPQVE